MALMEPNNNENNNEDPNSYYISQLPLSQQFALRERLKVVDQANNVNELRELLKDTLVSLAYQKHVTANMLLQTLPSLPPIAN